MTLVRCYSAEDAAETESKLIDFYQCELNLLDGSRRPAALRPVDADKADASQAIQETTRLPA